MSQFPCDPLLYPNVTEPGAWQDPDMLVVGMTIDRNMTDARMVWHIFTIGNQLLVALIACHQR